MYIHGLQLDQPLGITRYHDPASGWFTQEDPIGPGGLNLYGFADGDPVNFSDPFGLTGCDKQKQTCPSLGDRINAAMASASGTWRQAPSRSQRERQSR
ncbi:MAG: RHS repeat-associated core domain-containing protein [Gemmatimonadaceae bacterium]|nr:RHS repeat-associated core domain-containing protein [Gemmatimonadaceae bacterium]